MLEGNVNEWITRIRDEDQENVREFLEFSQGFFQRNRNFLSGAGFYIIGSAYTGKSVFYKNGDYRADENEKLNELGKEIADEFGIETIQRYNRRWETFEKGDSFPEIKRRFDEGFSRIREEMFKKEDYDDIDCVIVGLPRRKTKPELKIWKKFSRELRIRFPGAEHPPLESRNGFSHWDVYDWGMGENHYVVSDYRLLMPSSPKNTDIHFMVYNSDERFGQVAYKHDGPNDPLPFHWPTADVTVDMWKGLQDKNRLPYLPVVEFF